jgi:hypothetical protein
MATEGAFVVTLHNLMHTSDIFGSAVNQNSEFAQATGKISMITVQNRLGIPIFVPPSRSTAGTKPHVCWWSRRRSTRSAVRTPFGEMGQTRMFIDHVARISARDITHQKAG